MHRHFAEQNRWCLEKDICQGTQKLLVRKSERWVQNPQQAMNFLLFFKHMLTHSHFIIPKKRVFFDNIQESSMSGRYFPQNFPICDLSEADWFFWKIICTNWQKNSSFKKAEKS